VGYIGQGKSASALTKLQVLTQAQSWKSNNLHVLGLHFSAQLHNWHVSVTGEGPLKHGKSVGNDVSRQKKPSENLS